MKMQRKSEERNFRITIVIGITPTRFFHFLDFFLSKFLTPPLYFPILPNLMVPYIFPANLGLTRVIFQEVSICLLVLKIFILHCSVHQEGSKVIGVPGRVLKQGEDISFGFENRGATTFFSF